MVNSKKIGLGVGIISRRTAPLKWMFFLMDLNKMMPTGLNWSIVPSIGEFDKEPEKSYASLRTDVIKQCKNLNYKWVLFLDTDVFPTRDFINRLMSHDKDIVMGVYWMKDNFNQPIIYKEIGNGPIWNIKKNSLIEVGGGGLGCCLIKMDVFDTFDKHGIKWFDQDWWYEKNGKRIEVQTGEDHWFFEKAKQLGYKIYCDTNVLCDHYSSELDKFFPDRNTIASIMDDDIDIKINHDKPTAILWNQNKIKINGNTLKNRAIGGSETALIQLSQQLYNSGYNVFVCCNCDKEGDYNGVQYLNMSRINDIMGWFKQNTNRLVDVFISSRDSSPFEKRPPAEISCQWHHDMPQKESNLFIENTDLFLFVSNYQKNEYIKMHSIPEEKCFVIENGVDPERFKKLVEPIQNKCIYATTPFRGLDILLGVWPKIKEQCPTAVLDIYSDMSIYDEENGDVIQSIFDYGNKIKSKYDINFYKPVTQDELAIKLLESNLALYPCTWHETSCIFAKECNSAKIPIITSNLAALPETVKVGKLIDGDPYSEEYQQKFIEEAVAFLKNETSSIQLDFPESKTWKQVCDDMLYIFDCKKKSNSEKISKKENVNTPSYWNIRHNYNSSINYKDKDEDSRHDWVFRFIEGSSILDIGCGIGNFLKYIHFKDINKETYGVDISDTSINYCKEKIKGQFSVIEMNPTFLPYNNIDCITCFHTLEHLNNPEEYVNKWILSLKKNGLFIIIVPLNDISWFEHIQNFTLENLKEFAKKIKNTELVFLEKRKLSWKYDNGIDGEEALMILKWNGKQN